MQSPFQKFFKRSLLIWQKHYYKIFHLPQTNMVLQRFKHNHSIPILNYNWRYCSELLKNIDISKEVGTDNLPGRFLKDGTVILAKSVTEIWNLSIKSGIFPDPCKRAKLKQIFNKGSRMNPSSYRPFLLLPLISKIFEKILHGQMIDYLAQYNFLYKYQFGFKTKHSTDSCL